MKLYGEDTLFVSVEMSPSQKKNASINSMVKANKVTAKNILYKYIVILTKYCIKKILAKYVQISSRAFIIMYYSMLHVNFHYN